MYERRANRFLITVTAAMLLAGLTGCGMMNKPSAEITGVKIQNAGVTEATMLFDVKVGNPYSVPLPLSNLDYALSSSGQQFLTGQATTLGTVPANASKTLSVPVRISYMDLIKAVKGVRPGTTIPYKADLGLSADVPVMGSMRVPMSKEGELAIPSMPTSGSGLLDQIKGLAK